MATTDKIPTINSNRTEARQRDIERFILDKFDLPGLKKIGFIKSSRRSRENFLAIEKRVVTFFEFDNIYQYETALDEHQFIKAENIFSMFGFYNLMLIAWYFAMKQSGELAITGTVWLLSGQLAVALLGIIYFKEVINLYQSIGLILALVAIILLTIK